MLKLLWYIIESIQSTPLVFLALRQECFCNTASPMTGRGMRNKTYNTIDMPFFLTAGRWF
jgi:hypothetical protein